MYVSRLLLTLCFLSCASTSMAEDRCQSKFRAVSYDPWPEGVREAIDQLPDRLTNEDWDVDQCAHDDFEQSKKDYWHYRALLFEPEVGILLGDTFRDLVAQSLDQDDIAYDWQDTFVTISSTVLSENDIHPNFLYESETGPIFVGMAWILREHKCYEEWPAPSLANSTPRDYCVEEPMADDQPFTVKFVAGGNGAALIGSTMRLATDTDWDPDDAEDWANQAYLPKMLGRTVFETLMEKYVVVGHSELRSTRSVRFVFVDRSGNQGPSTEPEDPLPAPRSSKDSTTGNSSSNTMANICGSASSACPLMNVPENLVDAMRGGTIKFADLSPDVFNE